MTALELINKIIPLIANKGDKTVYVSFEQPGKIANSIPTGGTKLLYSVHIKNVIESDNVILIDLGEIS